MTTPNVTGLLQEIRSGDSEAFDALLRQVYDELRMLAHAQLYHERADHTLNTTGLVHEAYLRLVEARRHDWQNRAHFFGAAAQAMRRILIDYARARKAQKRKGIQVNLALAEDVRGDAVAVDHLLEIDDALQRLAEFDERLARVVECRYFAALTIQETAEALGVSHATVSNDWRMARAWLQRELAS
jgi:RNA polymerase sigma factor (TIGR02999 family)